MMEDADDDSDIPDEHENGFHYNEYIRHYNLNLEAKTWNKDSQGLFDFETSHLKKIKFKIKDPGQLIRIPKEICLLENMNFDMEAKYGWHAQKLMNIKKQRNFYVLESPDIETMKTMDPEMKRAFMARDVDEMYKPDTGERILPASEMNEKIYLIVRSIQDRNVK